MLIWLSPPFANGSMWSTVKSLVKWNVWHRRQNGPHLRISCRLALLYDPARFVGFPSSARGFVGFPSSARGFVGFPSSARGFVGFPSSARGFVGFPSSARGFVGFPSSARGFVGFPSSARGFVGFPGFVGFLSFGGGLKSFRRALRHSYHGYQWPQPTGDSPLEKNF